MERRNLFIVSVFLVFSLALSGVLCGQRVIDLDKVWGDMRVLGSNADDWSGYSVAYGDINGDGYNDIIIGTPTDTYIVNKPGKVYVIFGSINPPTTFDLSTLSPDITIYGQSIDDCCGYAVASGDVNGDGYDDIIIGAPDAGLVSPERMYVGKTYVIFGKSFASPTTIDLNSQTADITICGAAADDHSGWTLASGDVNGDAYDNLIIGARYASPSGRANAGETYVIFGSSYPSSPYTIDLRTQSADITVCGADEFDYCGSAVTSGDVNGDGYDDIVIGAYGADPGGRDFAGETFVIFGKSFASPTTIDLSTQSADITIYGKEAYYNSGSAVASGDVNGDGYDDIIIGALGASTVGAALGGKTYVIFGKSFASPTTIDLSTQSADITIYGKEAYYNSGSAVASGDVNGDNCDDIIIGAYQADPGSPSRTEAGETYLISGGGSFITAHGLGGKSWIKEFSLLGRVGGGFKAFGAVNSQGEVHLAVGDVDADSLDEIAAGHGENGTSCVKLFEIDGSIIGSFKAFGALNSGGEVHLAIGNFDADLNDKEIAAAHGEGGQSWVKLFKADGTFIRIFKAFGKANTQGEVHLAAADLDNNGVDEIIAGMGEGGSSVVKIFNRFGSLIRSFKAFGAVNSGGEVHLAIGNFDDDLNDTEIAAATGYDGSNLVRLFDMDGTFIRQFPAFSSGGNPNGEVQISAANMDNDGIDELICGHGEGGNSVVKVFKPDGTVIRRFKAFGGVNAQGEVHLGRSNY